MEHHHIEITSNLLSLQVSAHHGASILSLDTVDGIALLRRSPPRIDDIRQTACFPQVPHVHRIDSGRFAWRDSYYQLSANMPPESHHIHGEGWLSHDWKLMEHTSNHASLLLDYAGGDWPFRFRSRIDYSVHENQFLARMNITNLESFTVPVGLGFHPYFPKHSTSQVQAEVERLMMVDENMMPTTVTEQHLLLDVAKQGDLLDYYFDNCFSGWSRTAYIQQPDYDMVLTAEEPLNCLQCYAPEGEDYFCVEPVSHMPDAINAVDAIGKDIKGLGLQKQEHMQMLLAGDTLSASFSLTFRT